MRGLVGVQYLCFLIAFSASGCGGERQCEPGESVLCQEGEVWSVDSCGNLGEVVESCACGCLDDTSGCAPCSCDGQPEGTVQTRTRFESGSVPSGEECRSEEQTRVCEGGTWSEWSGSYTEESCHVEGEAPCGDVPHGETERRECYEAASVPYGETCASDEQNRTCDNGEWDPDWPDCDHLSCEVEPPASCGDTPHGDTESRECYDAPSVPPGETCTFDEQTRTCDDGEWDPDWPSCEYTSCVVEERESCGGVPHGGTERRECYEAASVPYGETCASVEQTRTCDDGAWDPDWPDCDHLSCEVEPPASCGDTPHGGDQTRSCYEAEVVYAPETCSAVEQTRTCDDGAWDPDWPACDYVSCRVISADCGDGVVDERYEDCEPSLTPVFPCVTLDLPVPALARCTSECLADTRACGELVAGRIMGDDQGAFPSMVRTDEGVLVVAFYDATLGDLKLARSLDGERWSVETVDSEGDVGSYAALALDPDGNPRVSYYDATNGALKHAAFDGTGWLIDTLDDSGDRGQSTSIAVDADGTSHISYYDDTGRSLRYIQWDGAAGPGEEVDSTFRDHGWYNSIALDSRGFPHISYFEDHLDDLKHAAWDGTAWQIEVVDDDRVPGPSAIVIDEDDVIHIGYVGDRTTLRYARGSEGLWEIDDVDTDDANGYVALALDVAGAPRLSYVADRGDEIRVASLGATGWVLADVLRADRLDRISLALASDSETHIAYYAGDDGQLRHLVVDGVASVNTAISGDEDVGLSVSAAVDSAGVAHIVFFNDTTDDLEYAHGTPGDWTIETIDAEGAVGQYASLGLDSTGSPQVAFYDVTAEALKLARLGDGGWEIEVVDDTRSAGRYPALALDAEDNPHVVYQAHTGDSDHLVYAYWDGSDWRFETIRSHTSVMGYSRRIGRFSSLALDDDGVPHVVFNLESQQLGRTESTSVVYTNRSGGSWDVSHTLGSFFSWGTTTTIDIDSAGHPHVIFHHGRDLYTARQYWLKHAWWDGTEWHDEEIIRYGRAPSLRIDGDDVLHVSYYNTSGRDLRLGARYDDTWYVRPVAEGVGSESSLALDGSGLPSIAYRDEDNFAVGYASF